MKTRHTRPEPSSPYQKKLLAPRWQKKRLEILSRDSWTCQSCYDDKSTLNVHHLIYFKDKEPWDYEDKYLTTLCDTCHENEELYHKIAMLMLTSVLTDQYLSRSVSALFRTLRDLPNIGLPPSLAVDIFCFAIFDDNCQDFIRDRYLEHMRATENEPQSVDQEHG